MQLTAGRFSDLRLTKRFLPICTARIDTKTTRPDHKQWIKCLLDFHLKTGTDAYSGATAPDLHRSSHLAISKQTTLKPAASLLTF